MAVSLPGGKRSREAWHLLGLLVGAKGKDWGSALMVLETALDEDDDEEEEVGASNGGKEGRDDSLASRLLADIEIDAASSAPSGLSPFDYHRDETEQLQADIQLRITKNVIIEVMEGPEAALLDQQSLLSYFSTAYALIKDVPGESRPSRWRVRR